MKYILVLFAVVAAASAQIIYSGASPYAAYGYGIPGIQTYSTINAVAAPAVVAAPAAYRVAAPVAVAAPVGVAGASYVAATRGAVHTAPLPGHIVGSTHVNTAPAPGTL